MLEELEKIIGYKFKNKELIGTALTHSSYANEKRSGSCNERLEFLGDAVLSIITAEYLYKTYKNKKEGELTKIRAALVCEKALSQFALELELGKALLLGNGERCSGGSHRPSILADAFEAVLAAIYLDGGMEKARDFVLRFISKELEKPKKHEITDYKSTLQEIIQQNSEERIEYFLVKEEGPDHDKHFVVEVHLNSNVIGKGGGRSKKDAEQQAARDALQLMGY
ncbi:MAG: ribonuclease III [Oscillospiraceae bacterium]|jgi:ribonuclease-3|nr:ribonuclease III [Oscillospiraceae bacterium]